MTNSFNRDPNKSISESIDDFEKSLVDAGRTHVLVMHRNVLFSFLIIALIIGYFAVPKTYFLTAQDNTKKLVNPYREPVIIIDEDARYAAKNNLEEKMVPIKNLKKSETFYIIPIARYSISGRLTAKNNFFVTYATFDRIAQMDLGLVWGDMAKDEYFHKLSSNNEELLDGSRALLTYFSKRYESEYKHKEQYLLNHFSQTHIIPANKNVINALKALRIGQVVQLDGYLVDVYNDKKKKIGVTSLSLNDGNNYFNGLKPDGASNEIMYVMRVQIDNKIFK